jgi:hypothetical protein
MPIPQEIPAFNSEDPAANILWDFELAGTVLRGLVTRGPFSLLAYIGVPREHWLAEMEELELSCHFGITFRGAGGDGGALPANWFWYGWDYAHFSDQLLPAPGFAVGRAIGGSKAWTVAEVVEDILDTAVVLLDSLRSAEQTVEGANWAALGKTP